MRADHQNAVGSRQKTENADSRQPLAVGRIRVTSLSTFRSLRLTYRSLPKAYCLLLSVSAFLLSIYSCGYTPRPGLPSHLQTVYVKPFINKIDVTQLTSSREQFPIYRHGMEIELTNAIINRFQFTGLMRPDSATHADAQLEGELIDFRRDALRYDASQQVEEWRLNVVVNVRFTDRINKTLLWEETQFTGDTTYFAIGPNTESESQALTRAMTDLARRIVERTIESW